MDKKRRLLTKMILITLLFLIAILPGSVVAGAATPVTNARPVTVMTRNLYLGADLSPVFSAIAAGDPGLIGAAVFQVYQEAIASDIPARAAALAHEITLAQPALVGLQETAIWTGPLGTVDFLPLIERALVVDGASYEVIAVAPGFASAFTVAPGVTIGLELRDVILARSDLQVSRLKLSNVQIGQYEAKVAFPLPDGSLIEIPRQWASVDVKTRGKSFRFITTHLESLSPPVLPVNVRYLQAQELLVGPLTTPLPIILVGDFNAEPGSAGDAAQLLIDNGFHDSWQATNPGLPGYTCCHPADLSNAGSTLATQIDLILTRGGFHVAAIEISGDEPSDFALLGRWPSDHAGVTATLLVPTAPDR